MKEIYNNTTLIQLEETKKLKNEINKLKDDLFKKNQIVSNYQKNEIKNIKNNSTNNNKENNKSLIDEILNLKNLLNSK